MVTVTPAIHYFSGKETYLKEGALEKLRSAVHENSPSGVDYKVFSAGSATAREIIDHASALPLFTAKKLIVIRDLSDLPKEDRARLLELFKAPPAETIFAILDDASSVPEWVSALGKTAAVTRCDPPRDSEIAGWIGRFASLRKKTIGEDAALALKELQGNDLATLSQEIEKLSLFVKDRPAITVEDVLKLSGRNVLSSTFDLVDAISEKDVDKAMRIISDILRSGKRQHEVIGLLFWHVQRMVKAKMFQARGDTPQSIAYALKVPPHHQAKFFKQVKLVSMEELKRRVDALLGADLDIKRTRLERSLSLESIVIRLCLG